jgi:hypothetical protein
MTARYWVLGFRRFEGILFLYASGTFYPVARRLVPEEQGPRPQRRERLVIRLLSYFLRLAHQGELLCALYVLVN